jgi:hypothetical protein
VEEPRSGRLATADADLPSLPYGASRRRLRAPCSARAGGRCGSLAGIRFRASTSGESSRALKLAGVAIRLAISPKRNRHECSDWTGASVRVRGSVLAVASDVCHEGSRPQPTGPDDCKGDAGVVRRRHRRQGGDYCSCPKAAVRVTPARLLLLCLLFRSSWLTVEGGRGRRRHSAASPGRTGSRGRVGRRGWWRSRGAASDSPTGSIETASKLGAVVPTESLRRLALVADDVARNAQGRAARVPRMVFPVFGSQLLAVVTVVAVCGFVA